MTIPPKKVINSNPGDADHVGGNDWDDVADYMNNVDKTGPVKINTRTYFRSGKAELRNPADTFSYVFIASALAADRNVTLPLLASNDTLAFNSFAATFSNKTLDATCDVSAAAGATGAPVAARYVTMATHASLTNEEVLTASDGIALVSGGAGGNTTLGIDIIDMARKRVGFIEDFFAFSSATFSSSGFFATDFSGTAASVDRLAVSETGIFGAWELTTGTTTTGRSAIYTGTTASFSLGQGVATFEGYVKIPTLSTVGEEFIIRIGFGDSTSTSGTDMVCFAYDRLSSVNWRIQCKSNGTSTITSTSTAVGTGWTRLKIVVNAAGTSAEFFIAGSSVGTIATNIPVGVGREVAVILSIIKSAGSTARVVDVDYIAMDMDLTTPR